METKFSCQCAHTILTRRTTAEKTDWQFFLTKNDSGKKKKKKSTDSMAGRTSDLCHRQTTP
ncbi:hypothetical protein COCNU_scaffold011803G000010 [Cocos nucifera]|nr:hypothetical protein [Cocos nucifera]